MTVVQQDQKAVKRKQLKAAGVFGKAGQARANLPRTQSKRMQARGGGQGIVHIAGNQPAPGDGNICHGQETGKGGTLAQA
ncbi:hypothetical protein SDC9_163379 [bioreactor metagenome]|uniref:Uncharacterized protein n=1 Tax=bioreactor metagenome TaxID=1076179 RepID=A0A645FNP5_9ZZZZ